MNEENASRFVYSTITRHDCSKIKKLRIDKEGDYSGEYPHLTDCVKFAVRKQVEELLLHLDLCEILLPECIFDNPSFVNLTLVDCKLKPTGKVIWEHLKKLVLVCCFLSDHVHNILCGSPVLETLELENCNGCNHLVIVSKSLKKLELGTELSGLEISCPNLEKLYLIGSFATHTVKFMNLSSLYHLTLHMDEYDESSSKKILQQLQHVESLNFGKWFFEFLSSLEVSAAQSFPLVNNKYLNLHSPNFDKDAAGIALVLHNSHLLEELVITKFCTERTDVPVSAEIYWSSNEAVFNCLESHLKFVEIQNVSERSPDYEHLLGFIEFILKNARVLEELLLVFENDDEDFEFEVCLRLCSFEICSDKATIEFLHFV